ncbi:MAG: chromosome partitioning protein ParB, partial [Nocardioides sp.]|nr:chromosome partitioning protein ParB [Nocardioides sp.]
MNRPQQRRGLGRGLGSLIPTAPTATDESGTPATPPEGSSAGEPPADDQVPTGAYFAELPIAQVQPNRVQPRQVF